MEKISVSKALGTELTLINTINLIRERELASNREILEIYYHLSLIEEKGTWKNPSYYEGCGQYLYLKDATFSIFLRDAVERSVIWYYNIKRILSLENGDQMYVKYGHENMVTYANYTIEQRKEVLEKYEASKIKRKFSSYELNSRKRSNRNTLISVDKDLERRYKNVLKELEKIKAENEELKKRLNKANKKLAEIQSFIQTKIA